jgi:REP element-mobilizing transposase RayT
MAIDIQKNLVRNSLRLKGYDYSQPGAYFVTICTENGVSYLGNIVDGITVSYPISDVIREICQEIPEKFQGVDLDAFIIMPNHVHGIVIINKECRDMIHQAPMDNFIKNNNVGLMNQAPTKNHSIDKKGCLINQARAKNRVPAKGQISKINQALIKNRYRTKNWNLMQDSKRTVGKIIRYFKAKTAKIVHDKFFPSFQWQRSYYEHMVRSAQELNSIREYIINNPIKWALDRENRLSKNFNMDLDNYFKDIFDK